MITTTAQQRKNITSSRRIEWLWLHAASICARRCYRECKRISIGTELLHSQVEDLTFLCRKITIFDTSPVIFRRFLLYLYGAPVDKNVGLESICELMLLADRYSVDSLKASWIILQISRLLIFWILGSLRANTDVDDRLRERHLHAGNFGSLQCKHLKS